LERGVRQLLADKISGNMVGLWLLIPVTKSKTAEAAFDRLSLSSA